MWKSSPREKTRILSVIFDEVTGRKKEESNMSKETFQSLGLNTTIVQIINQLQFKHPTPIQKQVIPAVLDGQRVIGQSQTGSGKTHAFLLPLFHQLDADKREVQIVITSPTRELAFQLHEEVKKMVRLANKEGVWTSRLLIGGTD